MCLYLSSTSSKPVSTRTCLNLSKPIQTLSKPVCLVLNLSRSLDSLATSRWTFKRRNCICWAILVFILFIYSLFINGYSNVYFYFQIQCISYIYIDLKFVLFILIQLICFYFTPVTSKNRYTHGFRIYL